MTHLTNYQKFQYQRYGNILLQDGSSTQNPNDPRLLPKNYDYEDDDYTFTRWVENQSELELFYPTSEGVIVIFVIVVFRQ